SPSAFSRIDWPRSTRPARSPSPLEDRRLRQQADHPRMSECIWAISPIRHSWPRRIHVSGRQTRLTFTDKPPGAASFAGTAPLAPSAATTPKLNPPDPWLSSRDEAVFLLQTTAEVEHALLVQYLYAAYSLDASRFTDPQKATVSKMKQTIIGIAREEMAHLASVQNVLRLLGGPIHLDREAFPYRSELS